MYARIEPRSQIETWRARFLVLSSIFRGVRVFASTHENGTSTTIDHQRWRHSGFMHPWHSTVTSNPRHVHLYRATEPDCSIVRAIPYPCPHLTRRMRFCLTSQKTTRVQRLTTNVGVVRASCTPMHSTEPSSPRRARFYRAAELDCRMADAVPYPDGHLSPRRSLFFLN